MRKAKSTDFFVEVPEIGAFRFGRRSYGDRLQVRAEFLRVVKTLADDAGDVTDGELSGLASIVAVYKVLCVECPAGFEDLEAIDLIDVPDAEDKILAIFQALRSKEDSFRGSKAAAAGGAIAGAGDEGVDGVLVPAEVQPVAAGPAVS